MFSPLTKELIESLRCLPGVGPRSAQRIALHLLERDRTGAVRLAHALENASDKIGHCKQCRILTEDDVCQICANPARNDKLLCVVETPSDVLALEQAGGYNGLYFVLMGHLSPLDGIGPDEIGIDALLNEARSRGVEEVILATNPTVEGEATAHYIAETLRPLNINITRIAHGVPLGGELEYVDGGTLAHALMGRKVMGS